jgi:hypothetical protein
MINPETVQVARKRTCTNSFPLRSEVAAIQGMSVLEEILGVS